MLYVDRPKEAPGCYGSGVCCKPDFKPCKACSHREGCAGLAHSSLKEVSKSVDVHDFLARHGDSQSEVATQARRHPPKVAKRTPSSNEIGLISGLSEKPRQVAEQLLKRGIEPGIHLKNKSNPFLGRKPRFLDATFQILLTRDTFTRSVLSEKIAEVAGIENRKTIHSLTSTAISVMKCFGVVHSLRCGRYVVRGRYDAS